MVFSAVFPCGSLGTLHSCTEWNFFCLVKFTTAKLVFKCCLNPTMNCLNLVTEDLLKLTHSLVYFVTCYPLLPPRHCSLTLPQLNIIIANHLSTLTYTTHCLQPGLFLSGISWLTRGKSTSGLRANKKIITDPPIQ